ncbi:MAG: DUF362 domain-containing protein [Methanobacterium sp.]
MKTHGLTIFTCAVKNMYGVVPGPKKLEYHKEAQKPSDFDKLVVDIYSLSKPNLNIVDGIIGMDGAGPSARNPKEMGMILTSTDGVAIDSYIYHVLGKGPLKVPTNKIAHENGVGNADLNKINVLGHEPEVRDDFKWPPNISATLNMVPNFISKGLMKLYWSRPAVEALNAGVNIPEFNYSECINCLCCMEMCPEKAVYLDKSLLSKLFSRKY